METFSQSEDPPGHSSSSIGINFLAGVIVVVTLFVPLYVTLEFSETGTPQAFPSKPENFSSKTAQGLNGLSKNRF